MRALLVALLMTLAQPVWAQSVTVTSPWTRATAPNAQAGAVFLTLTAAQANTLVSATTPAASQSLVHEVTNDGGTMRMREKAGGLPLPAGQAVTLAPGQFHVMLIGLKQPLNAGESFPLTLHFASGPDVTVTVPVAAAGATAPPK